MLCKPHKSGLLCSDSLSRLTAFHHISRLPFLWAGMRPQVAGCEGNAQGPGIIPGSIPGALTLCLSWTLALCSKPLVPIVAAKSQS